MGSKEEGDHQTHIRVCLQVFALIWMRGKGRLSLLLGYAHTHCIRRKKENMTNDVRSLPEKEKAQSLLCILLPEVVEGGSFGATVFSKLGHGGERR